MPCKYEKVYVALSGRSRNRRKLDGRWPLANGDLDPFNWREVQCLVTLTMRFHMHLDKCRTNRAAIIRPIRPRAESCRMASRRQQAALELVKMRVGRFEIRLCIFKLLNVLYETSVFFQIDFGCSNNDGRACWAYS